MIQISFFLDVKRGLYENYAWEQQRQQLHCKFHKSDQRNKLYFGNLVSTKILIFNSTIDFCSFPEKSANIVDGDSKERKKEICFCVCMLAICMRK